MPKDPAIEQRLQREFWIGSSAYGAWKMETKTPIVSYASLGAKNYSFETQDGERVLKSRGFDLASTAASEKINHEVMVDMLKKYLRGEEEKIVCPAFTMRIDRKTATVQNRSFQKSWSNSVFDKRVVMALNGLVEREPEAATVPFGLKSYEFEDCDKGDVF